MNLFFFKLLIILVIDKHHSGTKIIIHFISNYKTTQNILYFSRNSVRGDCMIILEYVLSGALEVSCVILRQLEALYNAVLLNSTTN